MSGMQFWKRMATGAEEARFERFRKLELDAADEILDGVMSKHGMSRKLGSLEPAVHVGDRYALKLGRSEKARRRLWRAFGGGHIAPCAPSFDYASDDGAFDELKSHIGAVKSMYLAAIAMSGEGDFPRPPEDAGERDVLRWVKGLRYELGVDHMLSAYYDDGVPLSFVVAEG